MSREIPVPFSTIEVNGVLLSGKTQFRRVVKPQPDPSVGCIYHVSRDGVLVARGCPYGRSGDHLWVRETWQAIHVFVDYETGHGEDLEFSAKIPKSNDHSWWTPVYYASDMQADYHRDDRGFPWRPSVHMPKWASRIKLEVKNTRIERLLAITEADAKEEGLSFHNVGGWGSPGNARVGDATARGAFLQLWDTLHDDENSCSSNPFVWVVEFKATAIKNGIQRVE